MNKGRLFSISSAIFGLVATSFPVVADTIIVPNFSFESPGGSVSTNTNPSVITNWVVSSPSFYGESPIGTQYTNSGNFVGLDYAFLNLDRAGTATLSSASSVATIADSMTYTLTVALGNATYASSNNYGSSGNMFISLLANGTAITGATDSVSAGTIADGNVEDFSVTFTTTASDPLAGEALTIQLGTTTTSASPDGGTAQATFDNVRLTDVSTVPEPSIWLTVALGLCGMVGWVHRGKGHLA